MLENIQHLRKNLKNDDDIFELTIKNIEKPRGYAIERLRNRLQSTNNIN